MGTLTNARKRARQGLSKIRTGAQAKLEARKSERALRKAREKKQREAYEEAYHKARLKALKVKARREAKEHVRTPRGKRVVKKIQGWRSAASEISSAITGKRTRKKKRRRRKKKKK